MTLYPSFSSHRDRAYVYFPILHLPLRPSFHPTSLSVFNIYSRSQLSRPPFARALHAVRRWMAKCAPGKSCTETRQTIRRPDYIPLPVSLSLSLYLSLSSSRCSICLKFHLLHITALVECTYRTYTTPPHTNTITDTNTSTNTINEMTLQLQP